MLVPMTHVVTIKLEGEILQILQEGGQGGEGARVVKKRLRVWEKGIRGQGQGERVGEKERGDDGEGEEGTRGPERVSNHSWACKGN